MSKQGCEQLMLYPEGSHASLSALPGSERARKMTVTSGRKCCELYRKSGPLGLLVKMCLESSIWRSTRCYLTWKASATPAKHLLFRLAASMPRTADIELRLWATPRANDAEKRGKISPDKRNGLPAEVLLWPTSTAAQCGMTAKTGGRKLEKSTKLGTQVALAEGLIPTPIATDWKNRGCKDSRKNREFQLQTYVGGQLNPTWVEWLMGFPIGWTDLDA